MTFNLKAISSDTILELLFSHSVTSDSLPLRGLQHARLCCPSLSPTVCSKFMSIELMMLSNHLILCHPLLLLPSVYSSIRVSSNESALHIKWPKYWSCSFSISPSNKYSGMFSFRSDWLDLLAVKGTLKNLPQQHNSKASMLIPIHDYWKKHSFDQTDICQQSNVFAF